MTQPWEISWKDYYDILGVDANCSPEAVKAAYLTKAQIFHPDKNRDQAPAVRKEAEREFKLINEAQETLRSAASRAAYDKARSSRSTGATESRTLLVEPNQITISTATGRFEFETTIDVDPPGLVSEEDLEIDCDDPAIEFRSLEVSRVISSRALPAKARVGGSFVGKGATTSTITYRYGSLACTQNLAISRSSVSRQEDVRRPVLHEEDTRHPDAEPRRSVGGLAIMAVLSGWLALAMDWLTLSATSVTGLAEALSPSSQFSFQPAVWREVLFLHSENTGVYIGYQIAAWTGAPARTDALIVLGLVSVGTLLVFSGMVRGYLLAQQRVLLFLVGLGLSGTAILESFQIFEFWREYHEGSLLLPGYGLAAIVLSGMAFVVSSLRPNRSR